MELQHKITIILAYIFSHVFAFTEDLYFIIQIKVTVIAFISA